jgi:hypothetical protein
MTMERHPHHRKTPFGKICLILMAAGSLATSAAAQIDYHNLDHGRPTTVEDAYPIERYAFDLSGGYSGHRFGAGRSLHLVSAELHYGFLNGADVGIAIPWALSAPGENSSGLAGLDLSLMFNLATETVRLPGLAVRVDGSFPAGRAGGKGTGLGLRGLATRSFGRHRIHLNALVALARPSETGLREETADWRIGLAVDRTLVRSSTLLLAETTLARVERGAPLVASFGLGARRQLAPALVLDGGLRAEWQRTRATVISVTLGFSHAFALGFLMPGGDR